MQKYHVSLWEADRREGSSSEAVPHTHFLAEDDMQARALALDEFKKLGKSFDSDAIVYAKVSSADEDKDKQEEPNDDAQGCCTVGDVVAWARSTGKSFVTDNELEWFLAF